MHLRRSHRLHRHLDHRDARHTGRFRFNQSGFYRDYTGPQRPAVSAIGAEGVFSTAAQTITVTVKMADPANGGTLSGVINLLNGSAPQSVSPVLIAPDTIQVSFPASMLPSAGFSAPQYTWNLWPRAVLGGSAAAQIDVVHPRQPDGQSASGVTPVCRASGPERSLRRMLARKAKLDRRLGVGNGRSEGVAR